MLTVMESSLVKTMAKIMTLMMTTISMTWYQAKNMMKEFVDRSKGDPELYK